MSYTNEYRLLPTFIDRYERTRKFGETTTGKLLNLFTAKVAQEYQSWVIVTEQGSMHAVVTSYTRTIPLSRRHGLGRL